MKLTNKILKGYSKNQLIEIILVQQQTIEIQGKRIQELEERVARLKKIAPPVQSHRAAMIISLLEINHCEKKVDETRGVNTDIRVIIGSQKKSLMK